MIRHFIKFGNIFLSVFNVTMFLFLLVLYSTLSYTKATFGDVSLPQLLFFVFYGGTDGVEDSLVYDVIFNMLIKPLLITFVVFFVLKKAYNGKNMFGNQYVLLMLILVILFFAWLVFYKILHFFYLKEFISLSIVFFGVYLLNIWRNISPFNCFVVIIMSLPLLWFGSFSKGGKNLILSCFNYEKTNFYEENYQNVDDFKIDGKTKRNVIIVFAESFENRFSNIEKNGTILKVNDEKAVKFSNLMEGYSQNWTQGALFSAFTGVHIHYLSDIFRYKVKKFKFFNGQRVLMATNHLGEKFDFDTPNITYLGDVAKFNDYNNIFMQGGKINFSGTDTFLFNHGFDKENVYDYEEFKGTREYDKALSWWGVSDNIVFEKFKDKISKIDKTNPFLAVMFTLDLHRGANPFYSNERLQAEATINNLNKFIAWFEKQDFYDNTTLIVIGDHRRMGQDALIGGNVYNAFFNLPQRLKGNLDIKRAFNQIDMFPTILDIMGVKLKDGKAGVGVSLFSKNKTIAERYSYNEQSSIFNKVDRFYQRLWEGERIFNRKAKNNEKFIAHAGGKIDGNVYTNSLEAMQKSVDRGYKYIELDLFATHTPPYKIIATHDCIRLCKMLGYDEKCDIDKIDIEKGRLLGKYTVLDDKKILDFFMKHKNLWFVTDKIDNFELLEQKFAKLKSRMIVEVFSLKKYKEAKKLGFEKVAYNIKSARDVGVVIDNDISMVTMNLNFVKNVDAIMELKKKGIKILGYTAKKFDDVRVMSKSVDMFYYDGEENLSDF